MLQDYRRRTTINPSAPILKDRSSKRWDSDLSMATNISLLSISNSSKSSSSSNDDENNLRQHPNERDSSSSRDSIASRTDDVEEHRTKHVDLDLYIFHKHLNRIPSTISYLVESDIDKSVDNLFADDKPSNQWGKDDYNPRSIRPPPFVQYIKQFRKSQTKMQPLRCRTACIPVRTTKSEQLKLARQQSNMASISKQPSMSSLIKIPKQRSSFNSSTQPSIMPLINRISRSRNNSDSSFRRSQSTRACRIALDSSRPLHLSALLVKQMQQDIRNNRVPTYSKPLNSALLREQTHAVFNHQFKMKRVRHWLDKLISTDYIEYNENASNESTLGTNFTDQLDDDSDLLSDEKLSDHTERTYAEAHRVLPLFRSEIHRKMQQYNLLLTRLELDLYVI